MAGHSLVDIAERLEFPSGAAVAGAIRNEVARQAAQTPAEDRASLLALENDRLNYMFSKVWDQIEFGDLKAIETGLKIINLRAKLNGLDAIDTSTHTTQVLVIGGAENDYIAGLKALSE